MRTAYGFALLTTICAVCALFDDRTFNGVSVWSKPFKFSLSLAVYFATLAWFAPLLPNGYIESRKGRWSDADSRGVRGIRDCVHRASGEPR